jgi:hypothetical protein
MYFFKSELSLPVSSAVEMSFFGLVIVKRIFGAKNFIGDGARGPNVGLRVVQTGEES